MSEPIDDGKILAFVRGELDPDETRLLEERMENDAEFRTQVAAYSSASSVVDTNADTNADLAPHQQHRRKWMKGAVWGGLAIAVSVVAFIVWVFAFDDEPETQEVASPNSVQEVEPANGDPALAPPPDSAEALQATEKTSERVAETPVGAEPPVAVETSPAEPSASMPTEQLSASAPSAQQAVQQVAPQAAAQAVQEATPQAAGGESAPAQKPETTVKAVKVDGKFGTLRKSCAVYDQPRTKAKKLNDASKGQRLWTEAGTKGWRKVYRRSGVAYIADDCFRAASPEIKSEIKSVGKAAAKPTSRSVAVAKQTEKVVETRTKQDSRSVTAAENESESVAAADLAGGDDGLLAEFVVESGYKTQLVESETKLALVKDSKKALSYLKGRLEGDTKCLPLSIPPAKLKGVIKLQVQVTVRGEIQSILLTPSVPDEQRIAECLKKKISTEPKALAGDKGVLTVALRVR